mgnify:CR=1 FL=1
MPAGAVYVLVGPNGAGKSTTMKLLTGYLAPSEGEARIAGYNVATDKFEDLVKAGVVDPKKVTRSALQNAASIAGLLLTTECMITEIPEKNKAPAGDPHGHGPGGGYRYAVVDGPWLAESIG